MSASAGAANPPSAAQPSGGLQSFAERVGKKRDHAVGVDTNFIIQDFKSHFSTRPPIACIVLQLFC